VGFTLYISSLHGVLVDRLHDKDILEWIQWSGGGGNGVLRVREGNEV
jgi:hypothetical protein